MKRLLKGLFITGLFVLSAAVITAEASEKGKVNGAIVLQTDFGERDGAVSAMRGVAFGEDRNLKVFDLTHEIPAYSIWDAAYRLYQTAEYWPSGTVFVSVVDPGVGTDRKSIVLKTRTGHYFVTPDNGTLTLVAEKMGIEEIREIDEAVNRRKNSEKSYTFHGRDVYVYTAAKLAGGKITFEEVGKKLPSKVVEIPYQKAKVEKNVIYGNIPSLDIQYGNVWTNIGRETVKSFNLKKGDKLDVEISEKGKIVYKGEIPFANSFGDVPDGMPLAYFNSLDNISFALNMDNFSEKHKISYGGEWTVKIVKK